MIRMRSLLPALGLGLLVVSVGVLRADDQGEKKAAKGKKGHAGLVERLRTLVPADVQDKLNLKDDQKKQIDTLQSEYQDKGKDALTQLGETLSQQRDAIKQAHQNKDKAALKTAMAPVKEKTEAVLAVRKDYLAKARDVLNDDQKKTFDDLTKSKGKKANKKPTSDNDK